MTTNLSTGSAAVCSLDHTAQPNRQDLRLLGLRMFAFSITVFNIVGHTLLGFEQAWITPFIALAAAYGTEIACEVAYAISRGIAPRFLAGRGQCIDFLLPAHITGLAVGMLVYANDDPWPVAFGAALAIASKTLLRVPSGNSSRHFFNPSNFGISAVFLLFPSVGVSPPYHFSEGLSGFWDWGLPLIILAAGSMLNARATRRLPLIATWVAGFALQAVVRSFLFDTPVEAALAPMTGVAFILFSLYMISDPGTTPSGTRCQMVFGGSVAAVYGLLLSLHIVFGLFFALTIVCALRGLTLVVRSKVEAERTLPSLRPGDLALQPIPRSAG